MYIFDLRIFKYKQLCCFNVRIFVGGGCVAVDVTVDEAVIEAAVDVGGGNDLPLVSLLLCP